MSPQIAIAVVSWNTRELLAACLQSLQPAADAGLAEVWVVDNDSSDGSPAMVRERFGWVHLVETGENLGYGPAVNVVGAQTTAPWVAPANSDLVFAEGSLEELLAAAQRHPQAGAFAPRLVLPSGDTQHSVHPFPTLPRLAAFNLGLQRVVPGLGERLGVEGYWSPEIERTVDWAHGAFLLVRREAWDAVGGFDPEQWMYAEDLDIGWRLARAGWPTVYVPASRVRHEVSASTTQAFGDDKAARAQARSYAWLLRRRGLLVTRAAAVINLAGAYGRFGWLRVAAKLSPARYAGKRDAAAGWAAMHHSGLRPADELRTLR